jgi:hypothetical protein
VVRILAHHVNKAVLVSIPPLFGNSAPQLCRLVGVEPGGLWLESEPLWRAAFPDSELPLAMVFVPFAQIAYLIGAPVMPPPTAAGRAGRPRRNSPSVDAEPGRKRR